MTAITAECETRHLHTVRPRIYTASFQRTLPQVARALITKLYFNLCRTQAISLNPPPARPPSPPIPTHRDSCCGLRQDLSEIQGGYGGGGWGLATTVVNSTHSIINSNANVSSTNLRDSDTINNNRGGAARVAVAAGGVKKGGGRSRIAPSKGRSLVSNAA